MPVSVIITLTSASSNTGPFNLYSCTGNTCSSTPVASNVPKSFLLSGYTVSVQSGTDTIRVESDGFCTNSIDIPIGGFIPSTPSPTPTLTPTPTPTLPLESFVMSATSLSAITITNLDSNSYPFIVNWGDGNVDYYNTGNHAPTHIYGSLFTGIITVSSQHLYDFDNFNITNTLTGSTTYLITIDTSEYTKLTDITTSSFGTKVLINGNISQLPRDLTYLLVQSSNISGSTYDLPTGLTNVQLYDTSNTNIVSGNTLGLPRSLNYCAIFADNTISGLTSGLPTGLTYCSIEGNNTIGGNTSNLPTGLLTLNIKGSNTISGNTSGLPSGLIYCYILGNNTISGDTSGLPINLLILQITGDNTISGDTSNLPLSLEFLYVHGDNTIGGDVINLPTGLTTIYLPGSGTTVGSYIYGDVADLPTNIQSCTILGYNQLTGSFSDFPSTLNDITIEGNNTISSYTSPHVWPTTMYNLSVYGSVVVTTPVIDNILSDLATYSTTWAGSVKSVKLRGVSTNPSAEATLISRGVTIDISI